MSRNNTDLAAQLENILGQLKDEDLASMDSNEILEMRKKLNPYGRTIEGANQYLNFSITQIHHEYWKKFLTSAMVAFLNRMCDEWKVPEGVPVVPVYDYLDDPTKIDTPASVLEKGYKPTIDNYEFNRKWMEKRVIVKEFLEEMFQFNPEEHVRSAYRPCREDTERKLITTKAGKLAVDHLKRTDKVFRAKEELYADVSSVTNNNKTDETRTKKIRKTVIGKDGKKKVVIKTVPVTYVDPKSASKKIEENNGKDPTCARTVREFLPPHDIYARFKMYYQSNYEDLRDFVRDAYCEKPELELAINPYSIHNTPEEAETFKKKHRNEVIAEIFTAHTGKWCFFDSFKEQRENTNFYNDNTIVLEEIIKQLESDERLGQDLMKKRVIKTKAKNVIEDGPDAPGLKKWVEQNTTIKKMGAEYIGDMADDDCPDDAVQVDVWRIAKGGTELSKDKFYTAAEAPTFVQEAHEKAGLNNPSSNLGSAVSIPPPQASRSNNLL